jgi:DNA-directed RNA polymerase specialized sigma24 family protein
MHHIEGLPVAQIAQVVGASPGTVMSRLARAREILRRKLAAHVEPEPVQR